MVMTTTSIPAPPLAKDKPSKGVSSVLADTKEFMRLLKIKGGLVPQSVVPTILGVSRQRVHQLVEEGTFSYWTFYGMKWLSQDEVISFAKLNRQAGENQYKPSRKQMWKDARETGAEFMRKRRASGS